MIPEQIALVENSWRTTLLAVPTIGKVFYARLFTTAPHLEPLFGAHPAIQQRKLVDTLTALVEHLGQPSVLAARVYRLGMRHSAYGVKAEHYDIVCDALMWSLRQCLASAFDPPTEQAWITAYKALANGMHSAEIDTAMFPR